MAGGNKKKRKPAPNPARAVATTSIQPKSKIEAAKEDNATSPGNSVIPASKTTTPAKEQSNGTTQSKDRDLHELSPEELEVQLERSELQLFVESHAAKARKDAARQVSKLQTDKRLLRGQADYLAVRDWLPEEIMLQILEFTNLDQDRESNVVKPQNLATGDSLLARVWNLSMCFHDLDIPLEPIHGVIVWLLQNPPPEDPSSQIWGLNEAFDWFALHCDSGELLEYDTIRRSQIPTAIDEVGTSLVPQPQDNQASITSAFDKMRNTTTPSDGSTTQPSSDVEDFEVSDIDSDAEPDQLLSAYLRTQERLYRLEPLTGEKSKTGKGKGHQIPGAASFTPGGRKLQAKLRRIESDVLFDNQDAEIRWEAERIKLVRDISERKRLQLSQNGDQERKHRITQTKEDASKSINVEAEDSTSEHDNDGDDMLGGMFNALPGVSDAGGDTLDGVDSKTERLVVKDFGKLTGISPRRVLEETCRSKDPGSQVRFKQVSHNTYNCRHAVDIHWTKSEETTEVAFMPLVTISSKPKILQVAMKSVATVDVAQSEAYVATAALFLLFCSSPKEEKARFRLPPAFRDLWDEFLEAKREHDYNVDRETVKGLRKLIDEHMISESDVDDEVVFKAGDRFRSGISTPVTRPDTPDRTTSQPSVMLQEMWTQKLNSESYQRMLPARMNLPMFHAKDEAMDVIEKHQVTIIVGDTGSGKSTQLPQFLLERSLSRGQPCKIYCTEPRRISAISLAYRVSEELGESKRDFGTPLSMVGYAVRLDSKVGASTRLVYATVGIVLRMLENEDGLQEITHLCLDEIHERSIDSDFLLIVLRSLMLKRPELKVILMSATVDAQKFSQYLDGAPIVSVPGRTFPVEAKFLEDAIELTGHTNEDAAATAASENDEDEFERGDRTSQSQLLANYSKRTVSTLAKYDEYRIDHNLIVKLLETVAYHQEYHRFSKAILVFLPGIAEIRQLNDMLGGHPSFIQGWRIHALHSSFSSEEQQAAFDVPPPGIRKIVLATNIAETGITIPDVTCVIDTGKHREMRFDERRQMSRLIQSFIARANAKQRRGRAGRVQEGICFHLFTRDRFENMMVDQQTPEMLRLSLQDLVMRVKICKLGDIEQTLSAALDPPSAKNIRRAIDALIEVDALTAKEQLTPLGHQLAKLPLDAQLGKLILYGATYGCMDFTLTIAAAMGGKSPFLSPMHAKKQADSVRLGFRRGDSDLLTLYNAYSTWRKVCTTPGLSEHTFCNKNFLSAQNLANIEDLKAQLLTALVDAGFVKLGIEDRAALTKIKPGSRRRNFVALPSTYTRTDDSDLIATSVVAWAFYPKIVKQEGKGWRNIANNQSLGLHPTSVNKTTLSPLVKYLSFYSIMQSASRFTNAQETSPVSDFALVLLAGEAVFHMYAGVIVIDGNRLRFKVRDWRTMIVLKTLRTKLREVMARLLKHPGRELGDRHRKWMEVMERIFEFRQNKTT